MKTNRYSLRRGDGKYWEVVRGGDEQFLLDKSKFTRDQALAKVKTYNDSLPKFEMRQMESFKTKMQGAASSEYICCDDLAIEAWGDLADRNGLSSMAYLWRRFGPPFMGCDKYKKIVAWVLTTPMPNVFLGVEVGACSMKYNVYYWINRDVFDVYQGTPKQHRQWESRFQNWFLKKNPQFNLKDAKQLEAAKTLYGTWRFDGTRIRAAERVIGKFPKHRIFVRRNGWRNSPPLIRKVNQALLDAMKELLRPVGVRDSSINIFGIADDVEMSKAERSIYAGLQVPPAAIKALLKDEK